MRSLVLCILESCFSCVSFLFVLFFRRGSSSHTSSSCTGVYLQDKLITQLFIEMTVLIIIYVV